MALSYFLFFFWLIILSWLLAKIRFVKNAGLGLQVIIALFICKVIAGLFSGWLAHGQPGSDSWFYHRSGLTEYRLLLSNPKEYFANFFYTGYSYGYGGFLNVQNSYWNDLKDNLIIKLLSVFDVFSGGNYYVNVVLYNFTIFFGHIGLYRVFNAMYRQHKLLTAAVVFLLPSVLFYSSAIHKDGLVLALIGVVVFNAWKILEGGRWLPRRIIYIGLSLALVFFFRLFVFMAFVPPLMAWFWAQKKNMQPVKIFLAVYAVLIVLFFSTPYLSPSINLPVYMAKRQADFLLLKGNTTMPMDTLQPTPAGFAKAAPQALQHGLLRPLLTDVKLSKMLLPLSIELVFYELLVVAFFLWRQPGFSFNRPFVFFSLFFGLSLCLIIGYTVPVIGAIVRYRSIYLPFIIAPFALGIDWAKLGTFAGIKK